MKVSYSNHIGRSVRDGKIGKSNIISTLGDLAAVEKHNNNYYTPEEVETLESCIDLSKTHLNCYFTSKNNKLIESDKPLDLVKIVKRIYQEVFDKVIEEYNKLQDERNTPHKKIRSYIEKVSKHKGMQLAVEGLIQIGEFTDWEDKSLAEKRACGEILLKLLEETIKGLNSKNALFILAGAWLHMNEKSPHLHYVAVTVELTPYAPDGLTRRIKKSAVINKETLGYVLQDVVREKAAILVQETFGWELKSKRTGRNEDRDKNTHINEKLKEQNAELEESREILLDDMSRLLLLKSDVENEINTKIQAFNSWKNQKEKEIDAIERYFSIISDFFMKIQCQSIFEEKSEDVEQLLLNVLSLVPRHKKEKAEAYLYDIRMCFAQKEEQTRLLLEKAKTYAASQKHSSLDDKIKNAEAISKSNNRSRDIEKER